YNALLPENPAFLPLHSAFSTALGVVIDVPVVASTNPSAGDLAQQISPQKNPQRLIQQTACWNIGNLRRATRARVRSTIRTRSACRRKVARQCMLHWSCI